MDLYIYPHRITKMLRHRVAATIYLICYDMRNQGDYKISYYICCQGNLILWITGFNQYFLASSRQVSDFISNCLSPSAFRKNTQWCQHNKIPRPFFSRNYLITINTDINNNFIIKNVYLVLCNSNSSSSSLSLLIHTITITVGR